MLQIIFKKLFVEFGYSIKEGRLLKYSSLFQPHICMRRDFIHILQPINILQQI